MATFQAQTMGLTGLTISSSGTNPTEAQLTQFLNDGVIDVTNRVIKYRPQDIENFTRQSSEQTSNGFNPGSSKIVSVVRESGTNNQWYPCKKSSMALEYRVTDVESLHYASKYNPVYMVSQNRNVHVYPAPTGAGNDTFKVLYVNYSPEESDGTSLDYASTGIKWFPDDKVYLVVLYASIKSLENAISAKSIPTISGDSTSAPVELTDVSPLDTDNTIDVLTSQDDVDQWWSSIGHLIEGEEDTELATAQIQKITAYVQAYQAQLQGNNTDYTWMQGRHQILSQQYERAFALMAPPQQQQQPQQPQRRSRR